MAISTWTPPPPPDPDTLKNPLPFAPFPLRQLRSGRIKKSLANGKIETAIYKAPLKGPVEVTTNGIVNDEHAYEPHRHPDKALLHYCTLHYNEWKKEIPTSEHCFTPGAFGENFFNDEVSEHTVCIGDRIAIGSVVVEVTEPRAPCYKLNHRFETKDMAKRSQTLFRTGWLYRIITPGNMQAGDMIRLLERPYPEWSVARVMFYLFIETNNMEMMKEIVQLPALGFEIKEKFQKRIDKGETEDQDQRMFGKSADDFMDSWNEYRLVQKRVESSAISRFIFEAVGDRPNPRPVEPGSHVRLKFGNSLVRAYSVVGGTDQRFELGIALDPASRGGSKYLHSQAKVQDVFVCSQITASFPLAKAAEEHILIAGGVGLTAFLVALQQLRSSNQKYHLHYAVAKDIPFRSELAQLGSNVTIYNKSRGERLDINSILSHAQSGSHVYTCGPPRLMDAVVESAKLYGIPEGSIHLENFTVETSGDPFTAELKQSGKIVEVSENQTLLDVLRSAGMDIDSSCEVGNCGTCKLDVLDGKVMHKGTGLLEEEKCGAMLSCVSRGVGQIILDL